MGNDRVNVRREGMTMIEMLVVLAIIAILAALLFPGIQGARERARKSMCLSNAHQISIGGLQWYQELGEDCPSFSVHWAQFGAVAEGLLPYVRNTPEIFSCPSFTREKQIDNKDELPNHPEHWNDYEVNSLVINFNGDNINKKQAMFTDYSQIAFAYDKYYERVNVRAHQGGINVAYLDGHAAWLNEEDYGPLVGADETTFYHKGHDVWVLEP